MINSGPLDKFYHWEKTVPHNVFLRQPIKGQWVEYSYAQAGKEIRRIATALRALALAPGIRYLLEHSDSKAIFLGKLDDYGKLIFVMSSGIPDFCFP